MFYSVSALGLGALLSAASDLKPAGKTLQLPAGQITQKLRQTAMPELGGEKLAKILSRYYADGLGGAENWSQIFSLKVSGQVKLESGEFELKAYQKKPDLIKISIRQHQRDLVLAYDGKIAWQKLPQRDAQAEPMDAGEARRFKHSGHFSNYLLYPYAAGKKIEYIDTVPTEGAICHQLRVTLDSDYQVDYYIDIRSWVERKVVNTDLRSGSTNTILYRDYRETSGMRVARKIKSYEDGEWVSLLTLDEVQVNAGILPWMFKMRH